MHQRHITGRKLVVRLVLMVAIIMGVWVSRQAVLGTTHVVRLAPAPELAGAISQSQATSGANAEVPVEGKDYKLQSTHYLDDGAWAVAEVRPVTGTTDQGTLVLERKDSGAYVVVLGPGTAFANSEAEKLPTDVKQYIKDRGVLLYEPTS